MKYLSLSASLLVSSLFIYSCGGTTNGKTSQLTKKDTAATVKDTPGKQTAEPAEEHDDDSPYPDLQFIPQEISKDVFATDVVLPGTSFSPLAALKQLFPGKYYAFQDPYKTGDSVRIEAWTSKDYPRQAYPGWFGEDPEAFPYAQGNITQFKDTLQFTDDNGVQNIFLSFSTLEVEQPEMMYCGRFSSAYFGLALFRMEDGAWHLKTFSPALGYFGSFQTLPEIHLTRFGRNNFGCYLANSNGGAGGPFYSDVYAFGVNENKFNMVFTESGVRRFNGGAAEWEMKLGSGSTTADDGFGDIQLTISGTYNKAAFVESGDTISNLPAEVGRLAGQKDTFNFVITRDYVFDKKMYYMRRARMTITEN